MSERKWTPGPWTSVDHSWSDSGIYGGGRRIAGLSIRDEATEENEATLTKEMTANATLIAAAPDLYRALEEAKHLLELYEQDATGEAFNSPLINNALAKARGETP